MASQPAPGRSALALWNGYSPGSPSHPYLTQKGIGTYGTRSITGQLVLPLSDTEGVVHGLQYIAANGAKRFLPGSKVTGHFFSLGKRSQRLLSYIEEGSATAASIHKAMGRQQVGRET